MRNDEHFWWTTLIRGFIALVAGSAIAVIPDMARTLLLLPMAIVIAVLGLAVYGILDSGLVLVTSYMAASRPARIALRVQGFVGVTVGILLIWVFADYVQLSWFLILILIQSLSTAIAELFVARHTMIAATSRWNYTVAGAAFAFSCLFLYFLTAQANQMSPRQMTGIVFGYLLVLGLAQCLTAARMLYADYKCEEESELAASLKEAIPCTHP